jgi:colanic acid/amylovoran biosynthesis glycosyltransferase
MHLTLVGGDCGDGTREKVLKSVQDAGIQDRITLLEAVDFNNLHAFMRDHDVFIHPSCYTEKRDCEGGAPVVLLDAQATGMPVIATRHCDIPDEVVHETTGLLAPEKDTGMLAEHIRTFYHMDADRYRTYCGAARQHVQRSYDVQACGARMRALYAAFLNQ